MIDIINRIIHADYHDPFVYLGVHFDPKNPAQVHFRTLQPAARTVILLIEGQRIGMVRTHSQGLFEIDLQKSSFSSQEFIAFDYQYEITFADGTVIRRNDPYRFLPQLDIKDAYLFNRGTNYRLHDHLGAHIKTLEHVAGTLYRVWAPRAKRVSVIGGFNGWDGRVHALRCLGSSGIWELFVPGVGEKEVYKYEIKTQNDELLVKSDPFQFFGELRPASASLTWDLKKYQWNDSAWQDHVAATSPYTSPIAIYEMHPGSWLRDDSDSNGFLNFRELAQRLIPHVKKLGFTHIELLPVMEHPLDESWGYQVSAPFSLTSRYGTPEDFMYFVDQCHQHMIGVILDWVPAHFPKDSHSLAHFDGSALYELEDPRMAHHPEWGTLIYNYGKNEVVNFLIASALFWIETYHIDGLRVDAVSSMLYLDYARRDGEWTTNKHGGRENLDAIAFMRHLNAIVYQKHPRILMIAEESTSYYGVSRPIDSGGLGFGFKWNMGWMNDILEYFVKDPLFRKFHHHNLTFPLMYAFSENFILPLSHDEVVHGKRSLLSKMPGDMWQKFANLRLLYTLLWCHPGKKLLFMGGEFGQLSEWYCKTGLDWHLLQENPHHRQLMAFVARLNSFYRSSPALWQRDYAEDGFMWLDSEDRQNSIISFARFGDNRQDHVVCIFNFTPQTRYDYTVGLPSHNDYIEIVCSDDREFGGSNASDKKIYCSTARRHAQAENCTTLTVPPLAALILQPLLHDKEKKMAAPNLSGDKVKKAVTMLTELKELYPEKSRQELLQEVQLKLDLSPLDCEFLNRHFNESTENPT